MFVTQVNHFIRSSSAHFSGSKTTKDKAFHSNKTSSSDLSKISYSRKPLHRATSSFGMEKDTKSIHLIQGRVSAQEKWRRIVDLFEVSQNQTEYYPNLYACLLKTDISKTNYNFRIPQTVIMDQQSNLQLFQAQRDKITKRVITKPEVKTIIRQAHQKTIEHLKQANRYSLYGQSVDISTNNSAPFVVIRWQRSQAKIQMENQRNFGENRWRASPDCLVQRYVYSRNLKAMVLRVTFNKAQRGEQHQQYCLHRFQNIANIFRHKNHDSHDLRAKVCPTLSRPNTLEHSKITSLGALQKLISPASEVRRLLETVTGKRVLKLSVDFIEDLTGNIWVIALRGPVFEEVSKINRKEQWLIASQVGYCRLCNGLFQKSQLENNVSVRMLLSFLHHLKRRTRIEQLGNIQFQSALSLNRKENAMSAVCECCYSLIIHELELKKYQRKLGKLCHIRAEEQDESSKSEGKLRQWRLMVYLQEIKETNNGIGHMQNVTVRYSLGRGVQQKWKCNLQQSSISVKKVKIHYFYSQTQDIEEFLKNTEIIISVLTCEGEDVLAQGSTGILANFKNKFVIENGQRQTTTVLLFFQSGKYCELTLKVGLVYDGVYRSPQVPLRKFNSILFPTRDCLNSNPIPKEWMQIFGFDGEIQLKECRQQDILKERKNKVGSKLKKKPVRYF